MLAEQTDIRLWEIKERCADIRRHERDILLLILQVGRLLAGLKTDTPYGEWGTLETRIAAESHTSTRQLRRYLLVYEQLGEHLAHLAQEQVQVGLGVLYALSSRAVADDVREAALGELSEKRQLTSERARELLAASEAVENTPPKVRDAVHAIVMENNVTNPAVIEGLGVIAATNPFLFEEIRQTGAIEDFEGEQIPVQQASRTDIKHAINMAEQIQRGESYERMKTIHGKPGHILSLLKHAMADQDAEYKITIYRRQP